MNVLPRLLESSSAERTFRGWQVTEVYPVTDAVGVELDDIAEANGIPRIGAKHPRKPIRVVSVTAQWVNADNGVAHVTVEYGVPDPDENGDGSDTEGEFEIDAVLVSETTYRDIRGAIMRVSYDGRPYVFTQAGEQQDVGRVQLTKVITANVDRPQVSLRFTRIEATADIDRIVSISGHVNQAPFLGYPAGTWMCRRINPRRIAGGRYRTTYELLYDARGWRAEGAVDYTGLVPFDATPGNGIEYFDIYPSADFGPLRVVL